MGVNRDNSGWNIQRHRHGNTHLINAATKIKSETVGQPTNNNIIDRQLSNKHKLISGMMQDSSLAPYLPINDVATIFEIAPKLR